MLVAGLIIYCELVTIFLIAWSRALPKAENTSRALARHLANRDPHQQPNGDWPAIPSVVSPFNHGLEITRG